jgi:hypothetical protein
LKTIIKKPHTFFFSLIPLFIIVGFIRKGSVIDVTIYNTFFVVKTDYWCYFSAIFVCLIGLNYYMLNWAKKPTIHMLSLFHIIFQLAALVAFLFCVFFINTKTVFMSSLLSNSINFYAILSASYVLFVISICLHILNFTFALLKKTS